MSLSDLASLGSFVSGVAVLVSLVFLYFQLRQMNAQVLQTEKISRHSSDRRGLTVRRAKTTLLHATRHLLKRGSRLRRAPMM
jgi:hypothetical protein